MKLLIDDLQKQNIIKTVSPSFLIQESLRYTNSKLGPSGELIVETGTHTGRAANDKYVVKTSLTENKVWWDNNVHTMSEDIFLKLKKNVLDYLDKQPRIYNTQRSIGNIEHYSLGIDLVTTEASASLFAQYMFKDFTSNAHNDYFRIIHAPNFTLDKNEYQTRSETVVVTCFKNKTTIIIGTHYAGEIKKSMFSIMNFLLPDLGILPMHSGANQKENGDSFVFFGLSGTGKTTLSTDVGTLLIGDDEHGLSDHGLFNFENGCYAKTYKLSYESEPSIFKASTQFGSFLENVELTQNQNIDFSDNKKTENGRSSYPLTFIKDRVKTGTGPIPKHIFFLTADAFGVLPPVAKLNLSQAMDYFILGYTSKLAGTEVGIKTPQATFSPCFGAPFMLLHPTVYSKLLSNYVTKYNIKIWLINTGWSGGEYGVGERLPLNTTRSIIRSIQNNELDQVNFIEDEIFKFNIPSQINNIEQKILFPKNSWKNQNDYLVAAKKMNESFLNQLKKIKIT